MNASQEKPIPSPSQPASPNDLLSDDELLLRRFEDDEIPNQRPSHGNWLRSKIASLPYAIRTELNQRLLDGEQSVPLAQWLNGLPEVQAVLAKRFGGKSISRESVLTWRRGPFHDWHRGQEQSVRMRELTGLAQELGAAEQSQLARGAQGLLALRMMELLVRADSPELPLFEVTAAIQGLARVLHGDRAEKRLALEKEKLAETKRQNGFIRQQHYHKEAAFHLKVLEDRRAKEIAEADNGSNADKINLLGKHLFGEYWNGIEKDPSGPDYVCLYPMEEIGTGKCGKMWPNYRPKYGASGGASARPLGEEGVSSASARPPVPLGEKEPLSVNSEPVPNVENGSGALASAGEPQGTNEGQEAAAVSEEPVAWSEDLEVERARRRRVLGVSTRPLSQRTNDQ